MDLVKNEGIPIKEEVVKTRESAVIKDEQTFAESVKPKQDASEFKKFLLACLWEKRISKNEIIMMNLV